MNYLTEVNKAQLTILLFLIPAFMFSQTVVKLKKDSAISFKFNRILADPSESVVSTYTREFEEEFIPKSSIIKPLPKPELKTVDMTVVSAADFNRRTLPAIRWIAKPYEAAELKQVPPFQFKDVALYNLKYLDKAHGFFSNSIATITQDSLGAIWLGSGGSGVCRLASPMMYIFTTESGFPSNHILDITTDSKNRIWISSDKGVCFLKNDSIYYTDSEAINKLTVNSVYEDKDGSIWLASNSGAFKISENIVEVYDDVSGLPGNIINIIYQDNDNRYWFGTNNNGLCIYNGQSFTSYTIHHGSEYNSVKSIYENSNGIWIGAFAAPLILYQDEKFYTYELFDGRQPTMYDFTENNQGLWMAAYGRGLVNINNNSYTLYSVSNGLSSRNSYKLLNGSYGNLWITDLFGGISRFGKNIFQANDINLGIPLRITEGIKKGQDGDIWYCPNGGELIKETADHYIKYTNDKTEPEFPLHHAFDIEILSNGEVFGSTYSAGVFKMLEDDFQYTRFDKGNFVMESSAFDQNQIWFSTMTNGLKLYKNDSFFDFTIENGLAEHNVTCLKHDSHGQLWVGFSHSGINIISHDSIVHIDTAAGLSSNLVSFIYPEKDRIWIGTDKGIDILSKKYTLRLNTSHGLISNNIKSIVKDDGGYFWIATSDGLSRIKFLNDTEISISNYGPEYGLYVTDFNSTVFKNDDGRIYWGTNRNILVYNPENESLISSNLKLIIEEVIIDNKLYKNYTSTRNPIIAKPGGSIFIVLSAIDWGYENDVKYQYALLDGSDTNWINNEKNNEIVIKDISYGSYDLLIVATGKYSSDRVKLKVEFLPYWWESKLFRIILILFFILTGPLILLLFIRNSKIKNRKLEVLIADKTNELVEENKIKDALVQEIHHRVKNNLQSITSLVEMQIFISTNDSERKSLIDMQLRIISMALVHEMLYSSDTVGTVSSKKYIVELVSSIIEMSNTEMLPVKLDIHVEELMLGMSDCISLGMLTSEVISNSIKYAFNEVAKPKISVVLSVENDMVNYTITDNGNGFNIKEVDQEKSLGLRLIDIFARQMEADIKIIDDNGTTVILTIPVDKLRKLAI